MLNPMTDAVEFHRPHEAWQSNAELIFCQWIQRLQPVRLACDEE